MNRIISFRRKMKMSQAEFAPLLGVAQQTLSSWENGTTVIPPKDAARLIRLAKRKGYIMSYNDLYKGLRG